ncbi:MAG: acyltransferase [Mycobacteriales bacterium]
MISRRRIDEAKFWWAYGRQRANAQWRLRGAQVGLQATILGRPQVEATDMVVGDHFKICSTYRRTLISGWGRIRIGDRVFINSGVVLFSALEIELGDDVAIANEAYVVDTNSHGVEGQPARSAPVRIGSGSWVGARAIVLPGVSIGKRVVVAAGAVVSRDVPEDTMVAGNPARVVRELHYPTGVTRAWHDA